MTTDTATLIEEVLPKVERVRALSHAIVGMTHLTTRFGVLFVKHRMQPKRILAMRLHYAGGRAAVAAMARRTAKLLRIVDLQKLLARMADKGAGKFVHLF